MAAVPDEAESAEVGYEGVGGDPGGFWEEVGWIGNQLPVFGILATRWYSGHGTRTSAENAENEPIADC